MLVFSVPVSVPHFSSLAAGTTYSLAFSLTVGTSKLWTSVQDITLGAFSAPSVSATPTGISVRGFFAAFSVQRCKCLKLVKCCTQKIYWPNYITNFIILVRSPKSRPVIRYFPPGLRLSF
jgi:hypothetical protein